MYRYAEHQDNSRTCFLIILIMICDLPPDHIRVLRDCPDHMMIGLDQLAFLEHGFLV